MSYPYTLNTGKLAQFLDHIQVAGVPEKFNQAYLAATEFRSSNDRALVPVMKGIGFVDASGSPTDRWKAYRDRSRSGHVLAEGVREGYAELFAMYPDANNRPTDAIRNFMVSKSSVGEKALACMVSTFQTLCQKAVFVVGSDGPADEDVGARRDVGGDAVVGKRGALARADVHIEIKIELPTNPTDPDTYEKIFSAMRRNLLSDSDA